MLQSCLKYPVENNRIYKSDGTVDDEKTDFEDLEINALNCLNLVQNL